MDEVERRRASRDGYRRMPSAARRRLLHGAGALLCCALGSAPAMALHDVTPITVPPLDEQVGNGPGLPGATPVPDATPDGGLPGTSPTTTPTTTPASSPAPPSATTTSPPSGSAPAKATRPSRRARPAARESGAASSPATALVDASRPADSRRAPAFDRLRDASLPAARQFGFPLGLGVAVLGFLAVQGRLDSRDPKLAMAPVSMRDDLLPFT